MKFNWGTWSTLEKLRKPLAAYKTGLLKPEPPSPKREKRRWTITFPKVDAK